MREIRRLVCHHTASPQTTTPAEIRRWHVDERGWSDVGYHWILYMDDAGDWTWAPGRPERRAGSHAKGRNKDSIGLVVCGDYTEHALPERAEIALAAMVAAKCLEHGVLLEDVVGHREIMPEGYTVCPGYDMDRIRERVRGHLAAAR